jgi:plastocyanin
MTAPRPALRLAVVLLSFGALLAGCGSGSSSSSSTVAKKSAAATPAVSSGPVKVAISNYAYHPVTITVKPGTKVTFTNHDQTAHTATSAKPGFDTGTLQPGASKTVTLDKPGVYTYYCQFHAFMHGTIVVK